MDKPSGEAVLTGFRELDDTFYELGKALGKGVLRRVGRAALEPMAEKARANIKGRNRSGRATGSTERSIHVGTTLARSQRAKARREGSTFRQDRQDGVTVYMGPGQDPAAITEEFGKYNQPANPYMRPAFDEEAEPTVQRVGAGLWPEIEKTAARRARKLARQAKG